jgi:hypothetical protein
VKEAAERFGLDVKDLKAAIAGPEDRSWLERAGKADLDHQQQVSSL